MTDWSLLLWTSETPAGRRCYGKREHRRDAGATGKGNTGGSPVPRELGMNSHFDRACPIA